MDGEKMRLIDADELYVDARFSEDEIPYVSVKQIIEQPTVDAVPVRHGKWINDNGLYKCSSCNEFTITGWANCIPIEQMNKTMKYCPHCGAKMR